MFGYMMNTDLSQFFKALCDETRQQILFHLMKQEQNVTQLVEIFHLSQPAISHHLMILKNVGLVSIRKEGKQIFYRVNCNCFEDCCKDFFDQFGYCISPKQDNT